MPSASEDPLPPDEAFAALGNETRMDILQALADAGEPLGFSELRRRLDTTDSSQFNYHLEKLVGHFVAKTDAGYELRRAGERIVESILSGAVTESPERDQSRVEQTCHYCGANVGIVYEEEQVTVYCQECPGEYGAVVGEENYGHLGTLYLPPAGVQGRDPTTILEAAYVWGGLGTLAAINGVCPRCSATIETTLDVCQDHDATLGEDHEAPGGVTAGVCDACGNRHAVIADFECTNCIYDRRGAFGVRLLATTELLAFLADHDLNPYRRPADAAIGQLMDFEERIDSVDPFEGRFTFTANGDSITLTVDEDLAVTDVTRHLAADE